jgi:hypothetical protein
VGEARKASEEEKIQARRSARSGVQRVAYIVLVALVVVFLKERRGIMKASKDSFHFVDFIRGTTQRRTCCCGH